MRIGHAPLVATIREDCGLCYTCVRECPAKAIRVTEGQASVIADDCIGCGNCLRVCARKAKRVHDSVPAVRSLLETARRTGEKVAVTVAPSHPAEFVDLQAGQLAGALRQLGFGAVHEVSFGADLVAREYARQLSDTQGRYIGSTCPAIVSYVTQFDSGQVKHLMPVISPMIASARVLRRKWGANTRVVFIGPCIAKKAEARDPAVAGEIDAVLTFVELRRLLEEYGIHPSSCAPSPFDPPSGAYGTLFPISRGLLRAAELKEDLLEGSILVAEGNSDFPRAIQSFGANDGNVRLLEVLSCNGCIMGAGMTSTDTLWQRREKVRETAKASLDKLDWETWKRDLAAFSEIPLTRTFTAGDRRLADPGEEELNTILAAAGKCRPEDELNCGACGYGTCRAHAIAVFRGLAEPEMCLPWTIHELRATVLKLEESHRTITSVREALTQSEKLATMGQLAAGIAHEVNNPLGVVLMYAHLLLEQAENRAGNAASTREDLLTIVENADRCRKIVAGLLNFARKNRVNRAPVELPSLISAALKAVRIPASIALTTEFKLKVPQAALDFDQMLQVLTNLITNACDSMPEGGALWVRCIDTDSSVQIAVEDRGTGIPKEIREKIFEPFFSTKGPGKGTGLGLAVAHGIVKMHQGNIEARPAEAGCGTVFTVTLPRIPQGESQ